MSELPSRHDFLAEHEPRVSEFLAVIHGQLDNASEEYGNDGNLIAPINDENLYAAKWLGTVPANLPEDIRALVPFDDNEIVSIHARHRYGTASSMINIWISTPEDDYEQGREFKSFAVGLRIDPRTGDLTWPDGDRAGSDQLGHVPIDPSDTLAIMDALFAGNDAYAAAPESLDITSRFQLGIATQPELGAEQYTVECAEKKFHNFSYEVSVLDRAHPDGKPSRTRITLRRTFEPEDFPDMVLRGQLEQQLIIEQDADERIVSLKRTSGAQVFDTPIPTKVTVNGEERDAMITMASEDAELPPELESRLYHDDTPTLADLDFFQQLATRPITEDDLRL